MKDTKNTALGEYYKSKGAIYGAEENSRSPLHFGDPDVEYRALHYAAGVRDVSGRTAIELSGRDVLDFVHRISTNSVKDMKAEEFRKTIFLTDRGRIVESVVLFHMGETFLCIGSGCDCDRLLAWLDTYIIMDDVHVRDATGERPLLEVWGPHAARIPSELGAVETGPSDAGRFALITMGGEEVTAAFVDSPGRPGHLFLAGGSRNGIPLIDAIAGAGAVLCGETAFEAFRVEHGIPESPREINGNFNPHDLALLDAVNFTKGCYIGQEVVERMDALGKAGKTLTGVVFDEPAIPGDEALHAATTDGAPAGVITSTAISPALGTLAGMGVLKKNAAPQGTRLVISGTAGFSGECTVRSFPLTEK